MYGIRSLPHHMYDTAVKELFKNENGSGIITMTNIKFVCCCDQNCRFYCSFWNWLYILPNSVNWYSNEIAFFVEITEIGTFLPCIAQWNQNMFHPNKCTSIVIDYRILDLPRISFIQFK